MFHRRPDYGQPSDPAVRALAEVIDSATGSGDESKLIESIERARILGDTDLTAVDRVTLHYFIANAHEGLRHIRTSGRSSVWSWRQPEFSDALFHLRLAMRDDGFAQVVPERRLQILTNAANLMNSIGRSIEALVLYDGAIALCEHVLDAPPFAMAAANKAIALRSLALSHYDPGQATGMLHAAYRWAKCAAAQQGQLEPGVAEGLVEFLAWIEKVLPRRFLARKSGIRRGTLGHSKREREYRAWCLSNRMFLNPLNDLGPISGAARDTLSMPAHVVPVGSPPVLIGLFNNLKQEYVSGRYMQWKGINADAPHFSDRETYLANTLDYPAHSLAVEQVRTAFRIAYSLLDETAFLLNAYMELGIPENRINLNRIWFRRGQPNPKAKDGGLNGDLIDRENWPLRGLYWLARDLYDEDAAFVGVVEPEAQGLKEIRNHIEHKCLRVHDPMWRAFEESGMDSATPQSIERSEFIVKTLGLFKLVRAAMIYACLAIHREEGVRGAEMPPNAIVPPIMLGLIEDHWKQ